MESNQQPADYKSAALPLSHTSIYGGWGWIRTIEAGGVRFTVWCIWPLYNPTLQLWGEYPQRFALKLFQGFGALRRNRTTDTGIFSPLLYRLSYQGIWRLGWGSNPRPPAWQAGVLTNWTTEPQVFYWWTF